jgi:hypothetical protein
MNRRAFIAGLFVAPAIIRPGLLMPVKPFIISVRTNWVIVGHVVGDLMAIANSGVDTEYGTVMVKISPLHGIIRIGDVVSVDLRTGEVV